jgi:hypothetical protein
MAINFNSCSSIKAKHATKENKKLVKKYNDYSHEIDALQLKIDSLQKADSILFDKIMNGDTLKNKKRNFR